MPDQSPAIIVTHSKRSTVYSTDEITGVASVRYQGGWIVRCEMADEFTSRRVATREYAEALAMRHAMAVA